MNQTNDLERYARQMRFAGIGEEGQRKLQQGRALVCGCGALGSVIANTLVRAGVGFIRIVDRDFLELNNLQRQVLYDEKDVASGLPKAIAAATRLRQINSEVEIEPIVADVNSTNIRSLADDIDVIVDGLFGHDFVKANGFREHLPGGHSRIQRRVWILKHELNPAMLKQL